MTAGLVIDLLGGPADLDAVLDIDRESFSSPWTRSMYEQDLANEQSRVFVARLPGIPVAGYCSTWLILDEVHINNVAVRLSCRRLGIGRALVTHVLMDGVARGAKAATLEVRRANESARKLYENLGFRERGVRPKYYDHPVDDALILWAEIQGLGESSAP